MVCIALKETIILPRTQLPREDYCLVHIATQRRLLSFSHSYMKNITLLCTQLRREDYCLVHTATYRRLLSRAHNYVEKITVWCTQLHREDYCLVHTAANANSNTAGDVRHNAPYFSIKYFKENHFKQ
jgi:hypothetical protein